MWLAPWVSRLCAVRGVHVRSSTTSSGSGLLQDSVDSEVSWAFLELPWCFGSPGDGFVKFRPRGLNSIQGLLEICIDFMAFDDIQSFQGVSLIFINFRVLQNSRFPRFYVDQSCINVHESWNNEYGSPGSRDAPYVLWYLITFIFRPVNSR